MTISKQSTKNLNEILITLYCFADDFVKQVLHSLHFAIERPKQDQPPIKKHNLSVAELISLAMFRFFTGHKNWKDFYNHIHTYHRADFPKLPTYQNFLKAVNSLSVVAVIMLNGFCSLFDIPFSMLQFADSSKLKVCKNKRIFNHKVCKGIAKRGKSSMGWFYGFKLHIICDEWMRILRFKFTPGNTDDRKGLDAMWDTVLGMIVADAGYIGKNWFDKARQTGKHLFTAVKANMKKLMTKTQHQILKMRGRVETVFSVLKLRMGLDSTLPRSPLGYFAHHLWCIVAYQFKQLFKKPLAKPMLA